MVIHREIFKNNQIKLINCFTFIPKTGLVFTVWEVSGSATDEKQNNEIKYATLKSFGKVCALKFNIER